MTIEQDNLSLSFYSTLGGEHDTVEAGERLAKTLAGGTVIFLEGPLGAGKTTFCRGIMRAFGHSASVKSPTYTLVEPYKFKTVDLFHFDLYRLSDPEELEFMGIRDYFTDSSLCLVEWPSKAQGFFPVPDLVVTLTVEGQGRGLTIEALSDKGHASIISLKG